MHLLCSHFAQSCQAGCCDKYGQCPQYSQLPCHHLYNNKEVVGMMYNLGPETYWIGLVAVILLAIGLITCWCLNRKKGNTSTEPYQAPSGIHPANIQYGGQQKRIPNTTMDPYSFKQTNVTGPVNNQYPSTVQTNNPTISNVPTTNLPQNMPMRQTNQPMSGQSFGPQASTVKTTVVNTQYSSAIPQYSSAMPQQTFTSTMPTQQFASTMPTTNTVNRQ